MTDDRMRRIALAFARCAATPRGRLCGACTDVLEVSGAGITVMGGHLAGPLCVSDNRMRALEAMQFTTGEGPCRDAFDTRTPVLASRLDGGASSRWPMFAGLAAECGIGAVFAYPLSSRGATVGVLTLYQDEAGDLSPIQHDDSLVVAELLGETVLGMQRSAPDGELAPELEHAVTYRAQVHQAAGMVAMQAQVSTADALVLLRANAFANGRSVDDVAADVVARRLRLDDVRPPTQGEEP